jgi:hydroxypyruvate isomerase
MTQSNNFTSKELIEYLTRLGKHINTIYGRLDAMDTQITIQTHAMTKLQQSFDATKREAVLLLIESLKQLPTIKVGDLPALPPIPTDPQET